MAALTWRQRWHTLDRWLYWPAWISFGLCGLGSAWNPETQAILVVVALLLVQLALLLGATTLLALHHRHQIGSWPGVLAIGVALALVNTVPAEIGGVLGGLRVFAQLTAILMLWFALGYRMVRHDGGLALLVIVVTLFAWSAAIANLSVGGPDHLALQLVTQANSGRLWWFNSLIIGLYCVCPVAPLTFLAWLGVRVWREVWGKGPI